MRHLTSRATLGGGPRSVVLGVLALAGVSLAGCGPSQPETAVPSNGTFDQHGDDVAGVSVRGLIRELTRTGVGPAGVVIDLTYAPPIFFDLSELPPPAEMNLRPSLAFMLQETVHEGALPDEPPVVLMVLDAGDRASPYDVTVTASDPHHRTTRLLFPDPYGWSTGSEASGANAVLKLVVPLANGTISAGNTFEWQLPIEFESPPAHPTGEGFP